MPPRIENGCGSDPVDIPHFVWLEQAKGIGWDAQWVVI